MSEDQLILVHLSDIHFYHKKSGSMFDLDIDLRNELEKDAANMAKRLGGVDGILITGDIAFAGKNKEYEETQKWLKSLSEKLKMGDNDENIWTVPGNHDIERTVIKNSPIIQSLQSGLRSAETTHEIDGKIEAVFTDREATAALLKPLQNYVNFSRIYEGDTRKIHPLYWEYDLILNDGSTLRLRGLNSTIVSNDTDDDETNKLIIGSVQVTLPREDGVEYLTLCHHPPDWLKDRDNVDSYLRNRARIQLFGHKHNQDVVKIGDSVRIIAGATHPGSAALERSPIYNFLSISVNNESGNRMLTVKVYPRIWSSEEKQFKGDYNAEGLDERIFSFNLSHWEPKDKFEKKLLTSKSEKVKNTNKIKDKKMSKSRQDNLNPTRRLVYRFLSLSFNQRLRIGINLDLIHNDDEGIQDPDLFKKMFKRAHEETKLEALWNKVEEAHENFNLTSNPFSKHKEE